MRDFTLKTYNLLLTALKQKGYSFQTYRGFLNEPKKKCVILRHDVDSRSINSLIAAKLENDMGIAGTYFFRIVPESFDIEVIKKINSMGHEIGYHYEDLVIAKGNSERALETFQRNLKAFRDIVRVDTICMHGSPLSKYDNRKLWEMYDYRDYGIIGEPYFDIDFNKVLYLTDSGRRWNGGAVSVRDKVPVGLACNEKFKVYTEDLRSTFDIINAARKNNLPDIIMLTIHPQRWNNGYLPWFREFLWQNIKNIVKRMMANRELK
jgi:hypothetical protein